MRIYDRSSVMLKNILLVRHAQSEEDVNPNIRSHLSDRRISITDTGRQQTLKLIDDLREFIGSYRRVLVYTSPSARAGQTMSLFTRAFPNIVFSMQVEESIRNLNWGSVTEKTIKEVEQERYRIGVLYFQFPDGDHTPTFVRNIERFTSSLLSRGREESHPECVIIFTHGFALRVLAKAFLGMSDNEFRYLRNPPNCYVANLIAEQTGVRITEPLPKITFEI